jgi:hypothetical protein
MNDNALPEGAEIIEGNEYVVEKSFINDFEQKTYIIKGIKNFGTTKLGMRWHGYNANRFATIESTQIEAEEFNYTLN